MLLSKPLIFLVFAWLFPNGETLKCYTCVDEKSCRNANITTCGRPSKDWPLYDRCAVNRVTSIVNGKKVVKMEVRGCMHAYNCFKAALCGPASKNDTCEAGCCQGDLCNGDSFVPSDPQTLEPSGPDLSCYSCSDLPMNASIEFKYASTTCSNPTKHMRKCSNQAYFRFIPGLKQDRCVTLKIKVKEPSGDMKELVVRNCSDASMCNLGDALWPKVLNSSMHGKMKSAQASCCHGNLCDSSTGIIAQPKSSLTCLTALFTMLLISVMTFE